MIYLQLKQILPSIVNTPSSMGSKSLQIEANELKAQEASIVSHVQAHLSSGGGMVSSPTYLYTTANDGSRFISSGDVTFKVFNIAEDPSAQLELATAIEKAALAPIDPTPQDRSVSFHAQALASLALKSINEQRADTSGDNVDVTV